MTGPLRVVLAEDHHVVRRGLAMVLQTDADFSVVGEAGDGQEAVEMALRIRPDLVLLDVRMPCLDGVRAAQIIKQQAPAVRILMLTGITPSPATLTMFHGAADGYILKDASPVELLEAMSHTNREIASSLSVNEETVRTHVKHILQKLAQPDRTNAVVAAVRAGLLDRG
jgi:DNA-binding NarL/FixJ family response regulator